VIGDDLGFTLIASCREEDAFREIFKDRCWKQHALSVPFPPTLAPQALAEFLI
jgi:hypothetical protein